MPNGRLFFGASPNEEGVVVTGSENVGGSVVKRVEGIVKKETEHSGKYTYTIEEIKNSQATLKDLYDMFFEGNEVPPNADQRGKEILGLLNDENFVKRLGKEQLSIILRKIPFDTIEESLLFDKNYIIKILDDELTKVIVDAFVLLPERLIKLLEKKEFIEKINDDDLFKIINESLFLFFLNNPERFLEYLSNYTIKIRVEKNKKLKGLFTKLGKEKILIDDLMSG